MLIVYFQFYNFFIKFLNHFQTKFYRCIFFCRDFFPCSLILFKRIVFSDGDVAFSRDFETCKFVKVEIFQYMVPFSRDFETCKFVKVEIFQYMVAFGRDFKTCKFVTVKIFPYMSLLAETCKFVNL